MTLSFKVPSFLSEYFNKQDHNGKEEVVKRYKSWYESDFTQLLLAEMEKQHALLVEQDEKKPDFLSWFQLSYITARNRAKRSYIKELIKKIDYKV